MGIYVLQDAGLVARVKTDFNGLMKKAAHSIVTRSACVKKGLNVLIICGKHNSAFAETLMQECHAAHASPQLWVFDEGLLRKNETVSKAMSRRFKLLKHTRALLENSDLVIWLTQFENPKTAPVVLGKAVCSYWDQVYEVVKAKPRLLVNLLSAQCLETMEIEYEASLTAFANAVNIDYGKVRNTGTGIAARLTGTNSIHISDENGTDLTFSIKNRRVGVEVGTLEDCISTGRECEVEVPAGEVYVAPIENSAYGTLATSEVRDFDTRNLRMEFEKGQIIRYKAEEGNDSFQKLLEEAQGDKDRIAELGIGINHGMKPMGLRIYDEKALGTAHIAIGNNMHMGGNNDASIHIDFILSKPTLEADNDIVMEEGKVAE